jgi:hypothetical protein
MFGEKTKLVNKAEAKNFYFIQRNPSMSGEVELNSNPPSSGSINFIIYLLL